MLPSSMRRVVAAPQSTAALRGPPSTLALSLNPAYQHRRRYSSSKPSSPNDSRKGIPNGQVTSAPASSTKQGAEKRRRKQPKDEHKLPSVPSTQHVPQESMALSTFFGQHRPISVTHSFPKAITDDAFAQIFASRTKSNKHQDVISTLSGAVDSLEQPMQSLDLGGQDSNAMEPHGDQIAKIQVRQADGSDSGMMVQLKAMSGQFLPFRPPPSPTPQSAAAAAAAAAEGSDANMELSPEHRVYKAVFTLEETTDSNGEVHITAHSPELTEEDSGPRSFLERMALRQIRRQWARREEDPGMLAISVRRQRKLKMKKKKYKKLMRRTRNERRKLDRV